VNEPNPYRAPQAPVRDPGGGRRGSTLAAVSAGLAADVVGTFVGSVIITLVLGMMVADQGGTAADRGAQLAESGGFQLFSLLFGLAFTVLGGYVAARVANHRELWHGMLLGIASLVFGELYIAFSGADIALWQRIAGWLLMVPAGIWGAALYRSRKRRAA
jgi:NADH:ubiquinone oxidoreductase subunit 6 (subunit J)